MVQDWERNRGWWEMKGGVESPGSVINVPPWDSLGQGWQQALGKLLTLFTLEPRKALAQFCSISGLGCLS